MIITIQALVKIIDSESDSEITSTTGLLSLDNLIYDESSLSDYIHHGNSRILESIDVVGGYITFKYDQKTGLKIITEYKSATKLSKKQLTALENYTIEQWEEGVGESFNNHLGDTKNLFFYAIRVTIKSVPSGNEKEESPIFSAVKRGVCCETVSHMTKQAFMTTCQIMQMQYDFNHASAIRIHSSLFDHTIHFAKAGWPKSNRL